MNMYDLILKKRNGSPLTKEEISDIVREYTEGTIPDYQMSAFLMAVYFQGMDPRETVDLTLAMADSGERLDLSDIQGIKVDKHSTGGVGDKTSLIIGPMLAALGIPVAKMSGRGLGHTGGTIDKLESIEGFRTDLSKEEFIRNVNRIKLAIAGQTANLAPADKKIYALRNATGTVDNYSLIAASIMSKKLASGADVIVLDIKTGSGAFMQTEEAAEQLARTMVSIGNLAGKKTYGIITDMNEPLGEMVGNSLEVQEAIEVLKGKGEARLREVSMTLASYMVVGAGMASDVKEAERMLEKTIEEGTAFEKMVEFVEAQGGNPQWIRHPELFPKAKSELPVYPKENGYLSACKNSEVGMACFVLGGGRATKESAIDPTVGIRLVKHLGDAVCTEEPFAYLYGNEEARLQEAEERLRQAYTISSTPVKVQPIIKKMILE
ncbi:MAG: pyrimidine-nucleoside phosphorylase [Bacteroides sp.]|nr:pyrimidine-nucleoside phosphorylase [Bacteroides sp.]MCM1549291.1 pyrimidine-nucleoside phosphorylase [Clostridium sp.]